MVEAINFAVINVKVHGTCCQWHLLSRYELRPLNAFPK